MSARFLLALLSPIAIMGCKDTGPVETAPNSYTIFTRIFLGGPASAKGKVLSEAKSFCKSKGQDMLLDHMQIEECAIRGGCGEATIYFYCSALDDPKATSSGSGWTAP